VKDETLASPAKADHNAIAFLRHLRAVNVGGLRVSSVLIAILVPLFLVPDYFLIPEHFSTLLVLRVAVSGYAVVTVTLTFWPFGKRWVSLLSTALFLLVGVVISAMIHLHQGYRDPYYAGLMLVILGAGVLMKWRLYECCLAYGGIYLSYVVPCLADEIQEASAFISNNFFLLSTIVVVTAAQHNNLRLLRSEFFSGRALQEALERLQELDRLKSNFFSNITHELRTPLTMILSPLESMLAGDLADLRPAQREHLEPIHRHALKLLKLINDLLDLAKLDERHVRLRAEQTDLVALVTEIIEHAQPLAGRKHVELGLEVRQFADDLHVDSERMERVLVNLVSNALKFTEPGGRITVWMDRSSKEVEIGVEDTGVGIPADRLDAVFERFSQADDSITRRYGGTGIGLALAKEIVELHGGRITVQSTVGRGSTFVVHLRRGVGHLDPYVLDRRRSEQEGPRRRSHDREPREWTQLLLERKDYRYLDLEHATERRIALRGSGRPKATKVLVVEDNVEVLRFINSQLTEEHDVFLAGDGKKGLELAQRELPNVIVTDYMMPEMDGLSMLRALRADPRTAQIPVILLTAKNLLEDRIDAREAGADVYLNKPFSPRELRSAVGQLLEKQGKQLSFLVHEQIKSLEVISAGLAHEIHNPLNYIRSALFVICEAAGELEQLVKNGALAEDRVGILGTANTKIARMRAIADKGVERIARMVEVVRNYAREGYPSEPSPLPLDATIRDLAKLVAPAHENSVEVELDLGAGDALVRCIPGEMQQAICNIWQNALDAVGKDGRVTLRTRREGALVSLEVSDNGCGIPSDQLGRVFTPFYTTKGPGEGLGLGLSVAYQVIHQAAGDLSLESQAGIGTRLRVRLPVYEPPQA
jgi:signal transduction histidine kinase